MKHLTYRSNKDRKRIDFNGFFVTIFNNNYLIRNFITIVSHTNYLYPRWKIYHLITEQISND